VIYMYKQYEMSTTPVLNNSHVVTERRRKRGGKNTRVSVITDFGHSLDDGSGVTRGSGGRSPSFCYYDGS